MLGVDKWTLATQEDLDQAIAKRKVRLDKEVEELLNITIGQNGHWERVKKLTEVLFKIAVSRKY